MKLAERSQKDFTQNVEKAVKWVKRKKVRRSKKKHSRSSPDVQIKEFSLTKQKTRPRTDYEWIGKTILVRKKFDPKNRRNSKNQSEIAACEQKNHYR